MQSKEKNRRRSERWLVLDGRSLPEEGDHLELQCPKWWSVKSTIALIFMLITDVQRPNSKSGNVCLHIANKFLNTDDTAYTFYCLGECPLSQNLPPRPTPISHLLQTASDILLHKGYEPGFLFSHLSLRWHLQYKCKWVAKREEHRIINIQLHRAAANDACCCFLLVLRGGG